MTNFSMLLKDYGKLIHISNLVPEEGKFCSLDFDGHLIHLEYKPEIGEIILFAHVGYLPQKNRESLYEMLLEANYFFRMTQGGVLGIDRSLEQIALVFKTPFTSVTPVVLEGIMETFVNLTVLWKETIRQWENTLPDKDTDRFQHTDFFHRLA